MGRILYVYMITQQVLPFAVVILYQPDGATGNLNDNKTKNNHNDRFILLKSLQKMMS